MPEMYASRLRITFQNDESVSRVVDVPKDKSLEFLHLTAMACYGLSPGEIASFYIVNQDNWEKTAEVPQVRVYDPDQHGNQQESACMEDVLIKDAINGKDQKLIYEYDSMLQWGFKVEWIEDREKSTDFDYPILVQESGKLPDHQLAKVTFLNTHASDEDLRETKILQNGQGYPDLDDDDFEFED